MTLTTATIDPIHTSHLTSGDPATDRPPADTTDDIYSRVTQQIISAIEAGAGEWRMPWHRTGVDSFAPVNAVSKRFYRGVNVLSLWVASQVLGYPTGYWATYRQWQELGAQVRKGEKSTLVVFWKVYGDDRPDQADEAQEETATDQVGRRFFARGYRVFNAAQVDGFTLPTLPDRPKAERIAGAETFFAALQADIRHGGNQAYYHKAGDYIQMPSFEAFEDAGAYYATLAHEATHMTGHASRLDRDLSGRFGSAAYAAEELVADLGAAFVCARLGLSHEPRPDHAAYLQSWLKVLKEDSRAIFTAASRCRPRWIGWPPGSPQRA